MHGCLLKAEADAMVQRLSEAEDAAGKAQASVSGLAYKTQVGLFLIPPDRRSKGKDSL